MLEPEVFLGERSDSVLILFDESTDFGGECLNERSNIFFVLDEFLFSIAWVSYVLNAIEDLGNSFESLHFKFIGSIIMCVNFA